MCFICKEHLSVRFAVTPCGINPCEIAVLIRTIYGFLSTFRLAWSSYCHEYLPVLYLKNKVYLMYFYSHFHSYCTQCLYIDLVPFVSAHSFKFNGRWIRRWILILRNCGSIEILCDRTSMKLNPDETVNAIQEQARCQWQMNIHKVTSTAIVVQWEELFTKVFVCLVTK